MFDKEFEFKGKHATYCRFLKNDIKLFRTFREAYTISAIVGFIYGNKAERDNSEKVQPASILPSELAQKRSQLIFIYRIIMLLDNNDNLSIDEIQNRTFKYDSEIEIEEHPEKFNANMELFNSYVLGGLEILYDRFKDCRDTKETVNELHDFLEEFYTDYNLKQETD